MASYQRQWSGQLESMCKNFYSSAKPQAAQTLPTNISGRSQRFPWLHATRKILRSHFEMQTLSCDNYVQHWCITRRQVQLVVVRAESSSMHQYTVSTYRILCDSSGDGRRARHDLCCSIITFVQGVLCVLNNGKNFLMDPVQYCIDLGRQCLKTAIAGGGKGGGAGIEEDVRSHFGIDVT